MRAGTDLKVAERRFTAEVSDDILRSIQVRGGTGMREKMDLRSALYKTIIIRDSKVLHTVGRTFGVPHIVCCMPHVTHCLLRVVR